MQNWMSFGKVAHDLVMRMQRIDGNNYPEVLQLLSPEQKDVFVLLLVYFTDRLFSFCSDIASYVHS